MKIQFNLTNLIFITSLLLWTLSSRGQNISLISEIYDYNVGDIFQSEEFGSSGWGGFVKFYSPLYRFDRFQFRGL
jgi:hypothetical protein